MGVAGTGGSEGVPPEGVPPEGVPPEGVPPEVVPPEGVPPEGVPLEGVPPEGSAAPPDALEGDAAPFDAPEAGPFYLYVLECADGSLYTGYTDDVERRAAVHNAGKGAKYTRSRLPVRVLALAEFATKHQAMSAEYRFKRLSRNQKDALIARSCTQDVPFARVLAERFGSSVEG